MNDRLQADLARGVSSADWIAILARHFADHGVEFGHGTDNAADEAFWLVRHVQRWPEEPLEREADPRLIPELAALAQRRVDERVPLAYLLGEAWFAGLPFYVDARVLIPRSPLAEIVEAGYAPWCRLAPGDRVLDIGTGSGCIAIATAVHDPYVVVDATDVSADALAVAARNVARYAIEDRVRLFEADLFPSVAERYRVIISNPPYVPADELARLPAEYGHEPALGLAGGASGLEITQRILAGAGRNLAADGVLIVEVGNEAQALAEAYPRLPLTWVEFERGGDGVFVITARELREAGL